MSRDDDSGRKAWLVDIRPAADPEGPGSRRRLVLAPDERAALRHVLAEMERPDAEAELLIDGQEEVFARSELTAAGPEHHATAGGKHASGARRTGRP
ncbi:MAG: hypothetical protein V7678_04680 [Brevundimonas sp.]